MRKRRRKGSIDTVEITDSPPPSTAETTPAEPGWLPDPFGRFHWRYWDGNGWTAHVSSWYRQEIDPDFSAAE